MAKSDRAQEANELEEIRVLLKGAPIAEAKGISSPILAKLYSGGTGCCNSARPDLWGRERATSPSTWKGKNQVSLGPRVGWGPSSLNQRLNPKQPPNPIGNLSSSESGEAIQQPAHVAVVK